VRCLPGWPGRVRRRSDDDDLHRRRHLDADRVGIGRSPDAGVFLDDVTVSRNHALLVRRRDGLYIDDLGSLNGTYVNRRRIESHRLADGDEIQVGKYKLSYLER